MAKAFPPLTFRAMSLSDKDSVTEICKNVFYGNDYVPKVFEKWVTDTTTNNFFGAEAEGRLVGFMNIRMIDNNTTGWLEGLRVDEAMRGRRYGQAILNESIRIVMEDKGGKRVRYSTGSYNVASITMALASGLHVVETLGYYRTLRCEEILEEFKRIAPEYEVLTALTQVDFAQLFKLLRALTAEERRALMPAGAIHVSWKFYECDLPETEHAFDKDCVVVLVETDTNGKLRSFSAGTIAFDSQFGMNWSPSVFADKPQSFYLHLRRHLELCLERNCKDLQAFFALQLRQWFIDHDLVKFAHEMYHNETVLLLEK
jgi:RimJ/RimL family protein N-acetyltransferase